MKNLSVFIGAGIISIFLNCSKSPTSPAPKDNTPASFMLTTTESSVAATIVRVPDKAAYKSGDTVMVIVTTNAGYTFNGWSGDTAATGDTLTLIIHKNTTLVARFTNSNTGKTVFLVHIDSVNGTVVLSPAGGVYDSGTVIGVIARPYYGFNFTGWSGALSGTDSIAALTVVNNATITATFTIDPNAKFNTLHINPSPVHGKITLDPAGVQSGDGFKFQPGVTITITAVPDGNYYLAAWNGDFSATDTSIKSIATVMDTDYTVSATFAKYPDGVIWTPRTSGTGNGLISATWTGTQVVVVGNVGTILTSPDGITWTSRVSGSAACLNSVIWTGTQLMAVGDSGTVLTSTDGVTWTKRVSGSTADHLQSVVWTGSQFVAVGGHILDYSSYNFVITSPNGVTWTRRTGGSGVWYGVAWNGSVLAAVGYDFHYVYITGYGYVDYSSSVIYSSTNGITWNPPSTSVNSYESFQDVTWSLGQFVTVGGSTGTVSYPPSFISIDGDSWVESYIYKRVFFYGITGTASNYVVVGDSGYVYTSPDANTWRSRASGTKSPLYGVAWTGSQVVAVGYGGTILTSP